MRILVCLIVASAAACAPDRGSEFEVSIAIPDGKSDQVRETQILVVSLTNEGHDYRFHGRSEVASVLEVTEATSTLVKVEVPSIAIRPGIDSVVSVRIDSDVFNWWDAATKLRFLLWAREVNVSDWYPIAMPVTITYPFGDPEFDTISYFEVIELHPRKQIGFVDTDVVGEATFPFKGFAGRDMEYRFVAFPLSTLGSLVGQYDFKLTATCNGAPCE